VPAASAVRTNAGSEQVEGGRSIAYGKICLVMIIRFRRLIVSLECRWLDTKSRLFRQKLGNEKFCRCCQIFACQRFV